MDCKLCFTTTDIANIYTLLNENPNITPEDFANKIKSMAGVNKLAFILTEFANKMEYAFKDEVLDKIKKAYPKVDAFLETSTQALDLFKQELEEIKAEKEELIKLKKDLQKYKFEIDSELVDLDYQFSSKYNLIKEELPVVDGVFTTSEEPMEFMGREFLNPDFIVRNQDGSIRVISDVSFILPKKYYTGDRDDNGIITVMYLVEKQK